VFPASDDDVDCSVCGATGTAPCDLTRHPELIQRASMMQPANEPAGPLYMVNGEPVSLDEFVQENADLLDAGDVDDIRHMAIGEEKYFGGGAGEVFTLRRMA
jgi:hypothetical protein